MSFVQQQSFFHRRIESFLEIDNDIETKNSLINVFEEFQLQYRPMSLFKKIFKKYGLKISGRKNELISRFVKLINCNCDDSCFSYSYHDSYQYREYTRKYTILNNNRNDNENDNDNDNENKNENKNDNDNENDNEEKLDCCICMDDIKNDNFKTECDHVFHKECLDEWLKNSSTCPICRSQVGSIVVQQRIPYYYTDGWYGVNRDISQVDNNNNQSGYEIAIRQLNQRQQNRRQQNQVSDIQSIQTRIHRLQEVINEARRETNQLIRFENERIRFVNETNRRIENSRRRREQYLNIINDSRETIISLTEQLEHFQTRQNLQQNNSVLQSNNENQPHHDEWYNTYLRERQRMISNNVRIDESLDRRILQLAYNLHAFNVNN